MAEISGPIEAVTIRGARFAVDGECDAALYLGGYQTETQVNGDISARKKMIPKSWSLTGLVLVVDNEQDDLQTLQDVADLKAFVPVTVTYVDGVVFEGTATVSGDLAYMNQSGTVNVDILGTGRAARQA